MIPVNDLRVGNWVEKTDITYAGAKKVKFQIKPLDFIHSDSYMPIPLTPDILKKCEFEMPAQTLLLDKDWFLYNNYDGFFIQIERQGDAEYICERFKIECKYLHQLQNLIYSLTNSELKINL